jgi:CBS domain-containing protein
MSVTSLEETSWFDSTPDGRLDADRPISELMTTSAQASALALVMPRAPAVSAFATVREVAHLMAARRLAQVRVRDARGEIVGVVSTSDLYRWVVGAAPDDERDDTGGGNA